MFSKTNIPSGPTEQEVREHFGDKLKADAKLMRPAYTSIWALEDGTLLWDWRNGFAELYPNIHVSYQVKVETSPKAKISIELSKRLECIIYLTGKQASGKSFLARLMEDAVEINLRSVNSRLPEDIRRAVWHNATKQTIVFTDQFNVHNLGEHIKALAEELGIRFYSIHLTRK